MILHLIVQHAIEFESSNSVKHYNLFRPPNLNYALIIFILT